MIEGKTGGGSDRRAFRQGWLLGGLGAILLPVSSISCTPNLPVDYAAYERIPHTATSAATRTLTYRSRKMRQRLYYGNYGGPGNKGGYPLDEMDELFRRHDIVYYAARTRKTMIAADEELVKGLTSVDADRLGPDARRYKERVVGFFRSPVSRVLGKPLVTLCSFREREGCYFRGPEVVREFFDKEHSGMPLDNDSHSHAQLRESGE